jgi:cation transport ATPase
VATVEESRVDFPIKGMHWAACAGKVERALHGVPGVDLRGVVTAIDLSRRTIRTVRQNLAWAFGYNLVLVPVAAGVLYPVAGILLSPLLAGGAMALSSVSVVLNSVRLRRFGA